MGAQKKQFVGFFFIALKNINKNISCVYTSHLTNNL